MGEQKPEKVKKHICTGLLAHVDAGKTTLSEALLYSSGSIRKLGRVDNQNAFLDTYKLERERGITIFSKQAVMQLDDETMVTLLDTPGHVDFSAEMERTLQVLDYAILVISGADGVQGHTETLWRLLSKYQVPTFLFINKMDQAGTDEIALMAELKNRLSDCCVDFSAGGEDAKIRHRNDEFLERAGNSLCTIISVFMIFCRFLLSFTKVLILFHCQYSFYLCCSISKKRRTCSRTSALLFHSA